MTILSKLNGKILRSRIDGANFTALIPFNPDNFQDRAIRPNDPERSRSGFNLSSLINFYKNSILEHFSLSENSVSSTPKGIRIIETNNMGLYCEISKRNFDIQILIQFKGLFFIKDNAFPLMQQLINELSIDLGHIFRLTLLDVAKDILLHPYQVLPYNKEIIESNFFCYNFKHQIVSYREQVGGDSIDTGFEIKNSRFKVKVYDKRHENSTHKNALKREYYDNLFNQFFDENGELLPVSRFELTLRQENCHQFSELFYDTSISEESFILTVLNRFSLKHSLRQREQNSTDQNTKRWPIHPNWKALFVTDSAMELSVKTGSSFHYSNPRINLERQVIKLAEALALKSDISLDTYSPDDLLKLLETNLKDIISLARGKRIEHEQTLLSQEVMLQRAERRYQDSQIPLVGDFL